MSRTTRQKMQSPAETSQSSETDPGKAEASGVVGLSADDNDYTNDRSNKRAASSSSSPLPSLSTSTPFAGVQTNFGEGGSEMDSRSIKKLKLEDVTCEQSDPVANPEKESLICRLEAAKATAVFDPAQMFDSQSIDLENLDVDRLMVFGYMELRMIIDWARLVPGFRTLSVENQMALLKSSFMELNVLRLAYRSVECPGHLKFALGIILPRSDCTKMGWGLELIDSTLEFVGRLKEVNLDPIEFSILNAVILASPDASGVIDRDTITAFQNQMLDCLEYYCATRYPASPRRYGKILLRLPALRTVSARAADNFLNLSLHGQVKMNALVAEMMS